MAIPEGYSSQRALQNFNRLVDTFGFDARQRAYLRLADVRTEADLYSLLTSAPELGEKGVFDTPKITSELLQSEGATLLRNRRDVEKASETFALGARAPAEAEFKEGDSVGDFSEDMLEELATDTPGPLAGEEAVFAEPCGAWPVRDQGQRGTCVSFAAIALYELFRCRQEQASDDLSEQFLYWAIKFHNLDGYPTSDGTWFRYAAQALDDFGTCFETTWNYNPVPTADVSHNPPPAGAESAAQSLRISTPQATDMFGTNDRARVLLDKLQQHNGVGIALPVFDAPSGRTHNWATPAAQAYGVVQAPLPGWTANGGHAVCCTGFVPDPLEPMGGHFIIRNSWNGHFGQLLPNASYLGPEPGYGQIAASHINDYLWEIMVF